VFFNEKLKFGNCCLCALWQLHSSMDFHIFFFTKSLFQDFY